MSGNMTGRVLNNRYQITERIGIGGMAEVYSAHDTVLGRIVAVKIMLPQYAADPSFTQRFKQEAAAAANLQSPYIVNVYDWGHDDETYFIVMEYVRGSDLKTAVIERGAINQRKVAEIGSQVCQALSAAHRLDIVHRDIKPQNIMVQPDGNVKVMDFGIARAKNSVKTQTSSVLGTAHYISPEQAQGKELTATSDIYSLGIVLYEAATGHLPFDGPDAVSVAMQQVNDMPRMPREINPDIDPAFEGIILRAMAKHPAERFATAHDMRQALNDYLTGRPGIPVGFAAAAETAVLGGGINPAGQAPVEGTAVMPPLGSVKAASSYRAGSPQKKGPNKKAIGIVVGIVAALLIAGGIAFALLNGSGGGEGIAIPDVKGKTVADATAVLEKAGFALGDTTEIFDDSTEAGKVVSTDPPADTKREKGTKVNLNVSKGADMVPVPDLHGLSAEKAKQMLAEAGLKGEAGPADYSSDVPINHVVKQSPEAESPVPKGSSVTYYLSLGTEAIEVPNVTNYSQRDATAALEGVGFVVKVATQYSETVDKGLVISQNPTGKADRGATVTITVSQGPEPKPEPKTFTITASVSGAGGAISPSGSVTVTEGDSQAFTFSPHDGYEVRSVSVDGVDQGAIASYTFNNINGNHSIAVTFQKKPVAPSPSPEQGSL